MSHGNCRGKKSPEYQSYTHAKYRCITPTDKDYTEYGARGITMCQRWLDSFEAFLEDMGPRLAGTTLDRKEVDGPYSKENCRWASLETQNKNRRKFTRRSRAQQLPQEPIHPDQPAVL